MALGLGGRVPAKHGSLGLALTTGGEVELGELHTSMLARPVLILNIHNIHDNSIPT